MAYRDWAVQYPQRYLLIFGSPIPGYQAPPEKTTPVAGRSLRPLISILDAARRSGRLEPASKPRIPTALREQLAGWKALHPVEDVYVLYLALVIWSRVHGLVMLEIDHQYPPFIQNPELIFDREIEIIVSEYLK